MPAAVALGDSGAVLVGASGDGVGSGVIAFMHDSTTWTAQRFDAGPFVDVTASGANIWALALCGADSEPACSLLITSHDDGTTWRVQSSSVTRISADQHDRLWAVSATPAAVLDSTDGGTSWQPATNPCGDPWPTPYVVTFATATDGMAACIGDAGAGSQDKEILGSSDGGTNWKVRSAFSASVDPQIVVGSLPGPHDLGGLSIRDGANGWMWTDFQLYATTDGGIDWKSLSLGSSDGSVTVVSAAIDSAGNGLALTRETQDQSVHLVQTVDHGGHWPTLMQWHIPEQVSP